MDTIARADRPHRVRFFIDTLDATSLLEKRATDIYWEFAKKFSLTPEYAWAAANDIKLQYTADDRPRDWFRQIRFYGDLTESEYIDYSLRFFKHEEEWK